MINSQFAYRRKLPLIPIQSLKFDIQNRLPRALFFILFLALAGCVSRPGATASFDSGYEPKPYVSRIDDDRSQALYHFGVARLRAMDGDFHGALTSLERAVALDPDSFFLRLSLARLHLDLGADEEAMTIAERLLILHPESAQAHLLMGTLLFNAGLDEEAAGYLRRTIELDPDEESAWLHLGIVYARLGEFSRSSETLRALLDRHPDSLAAELTLARLYRETGLLVLAEHYYLLILDKEPGFEPVVLELAGLYESTGEIDKAIALYGDMLANDPDHHEVRHYLVRLLILQERLGEAREELYRLVEEHPDDLEAWRRIGLIHLEMHEWEAANEAFALILKADPGNEQVRYYLGTSLERQGQWQEALRTFGEIPADSHLYPDALAHRSYLYHRLDRRDEAIALLESHLDVMTVRPALYSFLASLHETGGAYESARQVLERGLARFPEDVELLYHKGLVFEQMERRDDALVLMDRILRLDPKHPEALNYIAYTWAERGENLEEALGMALEAVALKADAGHIIDTLGWIYFRLGRFEEARVQLEKAVKHLPDDPLVRQHLGEIYLALGDDDHAREAFEKALELDPGNEEVLELLERVGR